MADYVRGSLNIEKSCSKEAICDCKQEPRFQKCDEFLSPCPKEILLECGIPGGSGIITSIDNPPIALASVNVDTSCFKNPIIKIQFSSQVTTDIPLDSSVAAFDRTEIILEYTLISKVDGNETGLGTWIYRREIPPQYVIPGSFGTLGIISTSDTFSFDKCICQQICPGCITFFVAVKALFITEYLGAVEGLTFKKTNARATVSKGEIAAFIQENQFM